MITEIRVENYPQKKPGPLLITLLIFLFTTSKQIIHLQIKKKRDLKWSEIVHGPKVPDENCLPHGSVSDINMKIIFPSLSWTLFLISFLLQFHVVANSHSRL